MEIFMSKRVVAFILCVILASALLCPMCAFADEDKTKIDVPNAKPVAPDGAEAEDGIDISFYRIRYCGGLITYFFGEWANAVDEETGDEYLTSEINLPIFILVCLVCAAAGYFLCSINSSIAISKRMYGADVRELTGGGAHSDLKAAFGWKAAILAILLDIVKTSVVIFLALLVGGEYCAYFAAIFCVAGDAWPCFFAFKGGKGVACAITAIAILEPAAALVLIIVFALILVGTKYISLGTIMCSLLYPLFLRGILGILHPSIPAQSKGLPVVLGFVLTIVMLIIHRKNMKSLFDGKETKFSFKKEKKEEKNI